MSEAFEFEYKRKKSRYRAIEDGSIIAEARSVTGHWYEHLIADIPPAHRVGLAALLSERANRAEYWTECERLREALAIAEAGVELRDEIIDGFRTDINAALDEVERLTSYERQVITDIIKNSDEVERHMRTNRPARVTEILARRAEHAKEQDDVRPK